MKKFRKKFPKQPTSKFKSKLEEDFNNFLIKLIFETKGQFLTSDRKKHLLIKAQHPNLDIRFVFSNSKTKIGKKSKTTYAKWCELKGFKYHCVYTTGKLLPDNWVKEVLNQQKML